MRTLPWWFISKLTTRDNAGLGYSHKTASGGLCSLLRTTHASPAVHCLQDGCKGTTSTTTIQITAATIPGSNPTDPASERASERAQLLSCLPGPSVSRQGFSCTFPRTEYVGLGLEGRREGLPGMGQGPDNPIPARGPTRPDSDTTTMGGGRPTTYNYKHFYYCM